MKTDRERFWDCAYEMGECLLWRGDIKPDGYGSFTLHSGQNIAAHRYAYALTNGSIPEGYEIDHLCRVRNCVRPSHLEAVEPIVNIRRMVPYKKDPKDFEKRDTRTKCLQGHDYTPENTMWIMGGRTCRTCYNM